MLALVNARAYAYDPVQNTYQRHDALVIDAGRIVALERTALGAGVELHDVEGATILPALSDAHLHLTDTGHFLGDRDLGKADSYDTFHARVSALVPEDGVIFAGGFDDARWHDGGCADAVALERVHADRRALLTRVDFHSCIVNRTTLTWLDLEPDTPGIERDADGAPTGRLTIDANWRAQTAFAAALPTVSRRSAERRANALALSRGVVHLHAQFVGLEREAYAAEIAAVRALPGKWYPKICEPDPQLAAELGLAYVGGDVFLDGSIGSGTAALCSPYCAGGDGSLTYSDDQVYSYFGTAEALGISAGVHAIGDRAIEQAVATWERVLGGRPSSRGCRHFIEHFEIASDEHIEACARMGIHLSVQPQFDASWGGRGRMYDERLGTTRARSMNRFATALHAGAVLCGGSDSPVCALDPLAGMQAFVDHHEHDERLSTRDALTAYTYNGALLGHAERETGRLAPGLAGDFVLLDRDPLDDARFADCTVLETWSDGLRLY